jgi:hypothetical protein
VFSKNILIKEIRRYKNQLPTAKDKETVQYTAMKGEQEPYINNRLNPNNDFLFPFDDSRDYDDKPSHYKIVFLKVQLSVKASLSRTDSLIHEYEESIAPKIEKAGFKKCYNEASMNGYGDYIPKMSLHYQDLLSNEKQYH